ncbi:hypothetical protein EVAR_83384_1 [Eumeta japonica]|uniref:Uncharacterized protein n=1 Tax=Eumeta variegata TaxID=151549 RepID=A0A4C1TYD8_EUMVA|nr:hypothetical protein EVAR_83384_1 [Eumeta japonica]
MVLNNFLFAIKRYPDDYRSSTLEDTLRHLIFVSQHFLKNRLSDTGDLGSILRSPSSSYSHAPPVRVPVACVALIAVILSPYALRLHREASIMNVAVTEYAATRTPFERSINEYKAAAF